MKFKIFSLFIVLLFFSCKQEQQDHGISIEVAEQQERMLKERKCQPYYEVVADSGRSQIDSIHFAKMNSFIYLKTNKCEDTKSIRLTNIIESSSKNKKRVIVWFDNTNDSIIYCNAKDKIVHFKHDGYSFQVKEDTIIVNQ
ncbi:hypothetical protein [Flavobacterium terrisoli]|uniref:hypothetical protein n=1 Tax=Flavobacterium terrisoli TaxID=3242195 RepID=UPI0025438DE5|nr:hypothetical protein [Flavobacterium buctense]